jgi:molybdopterin molybdotransferase
MAANADVRMKGFGKRASVAAVQALIAERVRPLGMERLPFRAALGRVLAEDIVSDRNIPPHPRSAMDGYAVRSSDLPGKLRIAGELLAADAWKGTLKTGEAIRIMTGAKIPDGADQVVMVEETKPSGDAVEIAATQPKPGQHILETGADLKIGQSVLHKGRRLRPEDLAMMVSLGVLEVSVMRRPRVRIMPTGSELVRAGRAQGSGVIESNSFMLEGLALRDGAEPIPHPIVPDDLEILRRAMRETGADVLVLTGGTSVGQEDYPPIVLREIGELWLHGVDVKPASPSGLGFIPETQTMVVLAPGYPVAAYVAWDLFVRPIVQAMEGAEVKLPYRTVRARLEKEYRKPASRIEVARVVLGASNEASVLPGGAAILSTITRADGFIVFPEGRDHFEAKSEVEVHLYGS